MTTSTSLLSRRTALRMTGALAATAALPPARAADKILRVPINMPFTGQEAHGTVLVKNGAVLAMDDINAKGGAAGYRLEPMLMDDGTATAGGYDPGRPPPMRAGWWTIPGFWWRSAPTTAAPARPCRRS